MPNQFLIFSEIICNHREERNIDGESRIFYLETLCHKILPLYQLIPLEHSAKLIRINHATFTTDRKPFEFSLFEAKVA